MSKIISILTPTRGRPGRLGEFIKSVYETATDRQRIEMLMYVDSDDEAKKMLIWIIFCFHRKNLQIFLGCILFLVNPKAYQNLGMICMKEV